MRPSLQWLTTGDTSAEATPALPHSGRLQATVSCLLASRQLRAARYGFQRPWWGEWAPPTGIAGAARCAHVRPANLLAGCSRHSPHLVADVSLAPMPGALQRAMKAIAASAACFAHIRFPLATTFTLTRIPSWTTENSDCDLQHRRSWLPPLILFKRSRSAMVLSGSHMECGP
jgi:hypothetical protein